jgi:hypothetical protein
MVMKIISFHTEGPYEREAARLAKSIEVLGLTDILDMETIPEVNWYNATVYKSLFIKKMLLKHSCPVLCVDADAVFHKTPVPFFTEVQEQGFHFAMFKSHWWQTGTTWTDGSPEAIALLDQWMMNVLETRLLQPDEVRGDTPNFNEVMMGKEYDWFKALPSEFCWFDLLERTEERSDDVVIEHLQASRDYREPRIASQPLIDRRTRRVIEIEKKLGMIG